MHVHKLERFWIYLSFVVIAFFIGTVIYGFTALDLRVVDKERSIDPEELSETKFADPGVYAAEEGAEAEYEVYVRTMQFAFQPGTGTPITLPADTRVTFYITSPDVLHGFDVAGTNLNTMAIPGRIAKFTTIFPEPRSYGIVCNEYCGLAHHFMEGTIEIVPKEEFDQSYLVE